MRIALCFANTLMGIAVMFNVPELFLYVSIYNHEMR